MAASLKMRRQAQPGTAARIAAMDGLKETGMEVVIRITRDERGYRASCPALPGCSIRAQSQQEAQKKIDQAVRGYIASLHAEVPLTGHVLAETPI